jgi:Rrf2 family transcriptional regulator, nitric oxide-sensitive transcriptional repressor
MLSKTAEYALRATYWLAKSADEAISADLLAEVTKVPRRYLHKVLQDLVRAGLVRSQSGPGGGYAFVPPPDDVTILDVVNAVAPLERITRCPLDLPSHTRLCPLHKELDRIYESAQESLRRITLGQVMRSPSKIIPLCDVIAGSVTQNPRRYPYDAIHETKQRRY